MDQQQQVFHSPAHTALANSKVKFGSIEVIAGCMFSGKTEELIRRLRRAEIARLDVRIYKPAIDTRYSVTDVVSHNSLRVPSLTVQHSSQILELGKGADVVGIDEAQFLDEGIVDVCNELANSGVRVIIAGLDLDYRGKPFGPMPNLLAVADYVTKTLAVCMRSGLPASRSQRLVASDELVVLGDGVQYEARNRSYFEPPKELS